jgi:hypothetical protein
MSTTRDEILKKYLKVCKDAAENDDVFAVFKSHPDYHEVLEHLSKNLGQRHLDLIIKNNSHLLSIDWLKLFLNNDYYGTPKTEDFKLFRMSPTTVQYISVLSNLIDHVRADLFDKISIVEIGGGYGGQAKIIYDLLDVKEYHIIDLYEATLLQTKYISKFGYKNFKAFPPDDFVPKEYDLFISNYAVSEVSPDDQFYYVVNVMLNCKHGYITCNQPLNGMHLLKEKFKTFKISPDIEGERKTNFLITW